MPSAIKTFQDFSNDPEFKSADNARVAKLAALAAVPGGVLAQGRVNQGFITAVHSMTVKKGNDFAFRNAKAALNAPWPVIYRDACAPSSLPASRHRGKFDRANLRYVAVPGFSLA